VSVSTPVAQSATETPIATMMTGTRFVTNRTIAAAMMSPVMVIWLKSLVP
jgi:hypothetical protein